MIVSYDCFLDTTQLNIFGSSKHLFKAFVSTFLPVIFISIAIIVSIMFKLILWKRIRLIWWILIAIITVLFNLYPNTASLILSIFNCYKIEGVFRMRRDLEIKCWEGSHNWWAFYFGVPMIVFFIFGIPILGIVVLFFNRKNLGRDYSWLVVLHQGFKYKVFYWEFVNIFWKVLLLCIRILIPLAN